MARPRPQQHLAEVVRIAGSGDATARIMGIIEKGLAAHREKEQAERLAQRGTLDKLNPHVSDAGKCPRAVWYSLRNIPESEPLTTDSIIRFQIGHMYEDWLAGILEVQGIGHAREQRVEIPIEGTVITGRRDFDTGAMVDNEDEIWEIKSTNARSLGFLLKEGKPRESNVHQLNLYMEAKERESGTLIYFATGSTKGEPLMQAWTVEYDARMAEADKEALALLNYAAKEGKAVDRPEGTKWSTFPCSYCSYKTTCWRDE